MHIDAEKIESEEEWAQLYCKALWLERWRNQNLAKLIASLFGEDQS